MMAPEYIRVAVLETLQWALVYCRNYSLKEEAQMSQVNELMEAIHAIPSILLGWREDSLDDIRLHFACFNSGKWEGSPDLIKYLDGALERANAAESVENLDNNNS